MIIHDRMIVNMNPWNNDMVSIATLAQKTPKTVKKRPHTGAPMGVAAFAMLKQRIATSPAAADK